MLLQRRANLGQQMCRSSVAQKVPNKRTALTLQDLARPVIQTFSGQTVKEEARTFSIRSPVPRPKGTSHEFSVHSLPLVTRIKATYLLVAAMLPSRGGSARPCCQ